LRSQISTSPYASIEIGAGKQDVQAVQILLDATIDGFSEAALNFDKTKRVFHFASNG